MNITHGEINIEDWKRSGDITEFANIMPHVSVDGQLVSASEYRIDVLDKKYQELDRRLCTIQAELNDIIAACPRFRTNKDAADKEPVDCEQCGSLLW